MRWLSTVLPSEVYGAFMRRLFPPACPFCREPVEKPGCCADCAAAIRIWPLASCQRCGRLLPEGNGICGRCMQRSPPYERSISLFVYQGPVRQAILDWKLGAKEAGIRWLLQAAEGGLREQLLDTDLLLPVPMPIKRMRRSGQHHAAQLCRHISRITGAAWDWRLLRRMGEQPRQSSLSGRARWRNLRKAFVLDDDYLARRRPLDGIGRLWIVDDIRTSGATLHYAARAMRKTGLPIGVLSLARTLSDG